MYKTLRRESLKRVLPRIISCAVVAAILLAVCGGGLIKLAAGPETLGEWFGDQKNGKYVSFDASEIIVAFANLTASNAEGRNQTLKTYYLLPLEDGTYMAVMDAKEHNAGVIDRAMEQSHAYYLGDLETLTPLGKVSGTVTALEDGMPEYMADCIDNYELPGYAEGSDSTELIVPCQINLDYAGVLPKPVVIGLGAAVLVVVLLLAVQVIVVTTGCYQKKVRAVIGEEADEMQFCDAAEIERVRVGTYIWFSKGPGSRAIPTADVIWGYAMPEPMVVSKYRWPVALYDQEQRLVRINFMEQKSCQAFLNTIAAQGHPFIKGYTSENAQKFQNDFPGFVKLAEREAKMRHTEQTEQI